MSRSMELFHSKTFALCLVVRSRAQLQNFHNRNDAVLGSPLPPPPAQEALSKEGDAVEPSLGQGSEVL